jgi:hypothetical protein
LFSPAAGGAVSRSNGSAINRLTTTTSFGKDGGFSSGTSYPPRPIFAHPSFIHARLALKITNRGP